MFSAAVSIGSRLKNWKMKPMWSRRSLVSAVSSRPTTSTPATVTSPEVGLSSPARMCISVDLPEPDGPITAVSRPRAMSSETPRRAGGAGGPPAEGGDGGVAIAVAAHDVTSGHDGGGDLGGLPVGRGEGMHGRSSGSVWGIHRPSRPVAQIWSLPASRGSLRRTLEVGEYREHPAVVLFA